MEKINACSAHKNVRLQYIKDALHILKLTHILHPKLLIRICIVFLNY